MRGVKGLRNATIKHRDNDFRGKIIRKTKYPSIVRKISPDGKEWTCKEGEYGLYCKNVNHPYPLNNKESNHEKTHYFCDCNGKYRAVFPDDRRESGIRAARIPCSATAATPFHGSGVCTPGTATTGTAAALSPSGTATATALPPPGTATTAATTSSPLPSSRSAATVRRSTVGRWDWSPDRTGNSRRLVNVLMK